MQLKITTFDFFKTTSSNKNGIKRGKYLNRCDFLIILQLKKNGQPKTY